MTIRIFIFTGLCLFFNRGYTQGLFETTANTATGDNNEKSTVLSGYARGVAWGGSAQNDFQSLFGEFALQTKLTTDKLFLSGDIRFREGFFFGERKSALEIKEAFAGYHGNKVDFFLGNQIIKWGRTDGFNPTDNICPNNYFFLSPGPEDQRMSNFMASTRIKMSSSSDLEIIGIPVYRPSEYRYDLLELDHNSSFTGLLLPPKAFKNGTIAARFSSEMPLAGFSFSWFHGFDPYYGFDIDSVSFDPVTMIRYQPTVYKKNTAGADFAIPVNSWIIRGEMALNLTRDYQIKMYIPNPDFSYVLGFEHEFAGFNTIIQYIGKYIGNFKSLSFPVMTEPTNQKAQLAFARDLIYYESKLFNRKIFLQQKKSNHAVFVNCYRRFANEIINLDLSCYYNFTSKEYLVRSLLEWDIADGLSACTGLYMMKGPENSLFEKAGKVLNGIFLGLTASF